MPELRLASFNTHYGLRPSTVRTPFDMTAALASLDADVIVAQEHWRPDGRRGAIDDAADALGLTVLTEELGRGTGSGRCPSYARDGEGTIGVSVLARVPVRRLGSIQVGPTPGDAAPARTALVAEVDVGGTPLRLVGVHLTSRLPYGPVQQLRRLARALQALGDGPPTVVAGDCNFWATGVRRLMPGWRLAVRGRTWPARWPHSQIDHVLVSPGIEVLEREVLPDIGSDHRPVRVVLRWH